ncbi:hypothetical protein PIB30_024749 [Stylosanthes scabra]|uniref:Uncharacterized protein n=1 Tax=Stylosanthes scabra TaxID=79078 RepID=A0ABU6TA23_9FABA|nr:hypothetical protein [Stylosanthes scabra]
MTIDKLSTTFFVAFATSSPSSIVRLPSRPGSRLEISNFAENLASSIVSNTGAVSGDFSFELWLQIMNTIKSKVTPGHEYNDSQQNRNSQGWARERPRNGEERRLQGRRLLDGPDLDKDKRIRKMQRKMRMLKKRLGKRIRVESSSSRKSDSTGPRVQRVTRHRSSPPGEVRRQSPRRETEDGRTHHRGNTRRSRTRSYSLERSYGSSTSSCGPVRQRERHEPVIIGKTPFSPEVVKIRLPRNFDKPTDMKYDGTSDSLEHINAFEARMNLDGVSDAIRCKAFPVTLTGQTMVERHTGSGQLMFDCGTWKATSGDT